jgi:hypothetical protein
MVDVRGEHLTSPPVALNLEATVGKESAFTEYYAAQANLEAKMIHAVTVRYNVLVSPSQR